MFKPCLHSMAVIAVGFLLGLVEGAELSDVPSDEPRPCSGTPGTCCCVCVGALPMNSLTVTLPSLHT